MKRSAWWIGGGLWAAALAVPPMRAPGLWWAWAPLVVSLALAAAAAWHWRRPVVAWVAMARRPSASLQTWAFDLGRLEPVTGPSWPRDLPRPEQLMDAGHRDDIERHAALAARGEAKDLLIDHAQHRWRLRFLPGAYHNMVVCRIEDAASAARTADTAGAVVASIPAPACLLDAQHRIVAMNPGFRDNLARSDDGEFAQAWRDPKVRDEVAARTVRCLQTGGDDEMLLHAGGSPYWVSWRATSLDSGPHVLCVATPRGAEERTRHALHDAEARLAGLFGGSPTPVVQYDHMGNVRDWNPEAARQFGWSREEAIGRPYPPLDGNDEERSMWLSNAMRRVQKGVRTARRRRDGTVHLYEAYTAPLRDAAGTATGMVAVYVDPADRERTARQRQEIEELRSVDALKTTFLSTAAHELATPLTPLKLQIHTLMATASETQLPKFQVVQRNIVRMERLVRDILDAARLESQRLHIDQGRVPMGAIIQGCVETFQGSAEERGIHLEYNGDAGDVDGDAVRLDQVVTNLVSNALKFTQEGGTVRIEARSLDGGVEMRVADTGLGLTPEQRDGLFQPFVQFHRSHTGPAVGTGLGLYISKGIVEAHGGRMHVESDGPGQGTCFTVWLPARHEDIIEGPALDIRARS